MGANSALRKVAKTILYPVTNDRIYNYVQAVSKAWDIKNGTWYEPEIELLKYGLRTGEVALDIGANYGLYAYYMSRAVGRTGRVFSFEPVPFTYKSLKTVAKLLGFSRNVDLVDKGCGLENGTITFSVPVQRSGAIAAGLSYMRGRNDDRAGKETQVRWDATTEVEAEVVRLDDFLPDIADLPMVKIDIEGAEYFCFQGAENLFAKHLPTTICEINPWYLDGFGVKTNDVASFFTDKGYQIFSYVKENGRGELRPVAVEEIVEDNYLFLHPSRSDRFSELFSDR